MLEEIIERKNVVDKPHNVMMENRNKMNITGVKEVFTFNDTDGIVDTYKGVMFIKGKNMHLEKLNLDLNELAMTGQIESIQYKMTYNNPKDSFLKRLLS